MKISGQHLNAKKQLDNLLINYTKGSYDVDMEEITRLAIETEFDIYADLTLENYRAYFDVLFHDRKNEDHYCSLAVLLYERGHANEAIEYLNKGIASPTIEEVSPMTFLRDEFAITAKYIGSSPYLTEQIHRAAHCDHEVLIEGETGTGKELVARLIRDLSKRKNEHFEAISCAEIPPELIDSELFGHVKGAFTGALRDRPGIFKTADKGIVFLDELNELAPYLQAKLLRFLQEKKIRPVGSDHSEKVDVQVLFATNQNVSVMLEKGELREDLYYRIGILTVSIPPLRDRKEIIPVLAQHFVDKYKRHSQKLLTLTASAIKLFQSHPWPGNIRELENLIKVVVANIHDGPVTPAHFTEYFQRTSGPTSLLSKAVSGKWTERELIEKYQEIILAECEGNKTDASKILGIDRSTFAKRRTKKTMKKSI